jgi:glutamine---fructose-6-phosphate transaminase (isomerizing)
MCGIFGFGVKSTSKLFENTTLIKDMSRFLFKQIENRGKDAAGISIDTGDHIFVYNEPMSASVFVKTEQYRSAVDDQLTHRRKDSDYVFIMGHARMLTNGDAVTNQPMEKKGIVVAHNGIIINEKELWDSLETLEKKETTVDTEVITAILNQNAGKCNNLIKASRLLFDELIGSNTLAFLSNKYQEVVFGTSNGSLYYFYDPKKSLFVFTSERKFLEKFLKHFNYDGDVIQVKPRTFVSFDLNEFSGNIIDQSADIRSFDSSPITFNSRPKNIIKKKSTTPIVSVMNFERNIGALIAEEKKLKIDVEKLKELKRCSKCLLPSTFPYINYDDSGLCNYCRDYKKIEYKGAVLLKQDVNKILKGNRKCLVALSGGRDSSYGLHYVKEVLGVEPLAYTYDWGMVTDIARRNISRMCGELQVEHILIAADIRKKRENVKKNVLAWLKRPSLGTVPLFMAGDKQYFSYANKLMHEHNIDGLVMSENPLERTHFKHGFCGIKYCDSRKTAYDFSFLNNLKMINYYVGEFIRNPNFLNSSLFDTVAGYFSYYLIPHNYIYLFNYIKWDEKVVEGTLIDNYGWEVDKNYSSTWRIGDATSGFYNYIYCKVAGFTEHDTFRSNQIREGVMSREEGFARILKDNRPNYSSIKNYCSVLELDFCQVIETVNNIKPMY